MQTQRVVIQDLTKPGAPTVTEMLVTNCTHVGGDMLRFKHPDDTVTIIRMAPGWDVTFADEDEEDWE